jgi:hypothetical protein
MDKISISTWMSRVLRKNSKAKTFVLGANQEFRRPPSRLLRDEPRGGHRTGMSDSHEIGGCLCVRKSSGKEEVPRNTETFHRDPAG